MDRSLKRTLSHVRWIGGATDSGKSTVARTIAERQQLSLYHYDDHDLAHHKQLAARYSHYRAYLDASLEERWVNPEPEALFQRTLSSFRDRFPLLIEDVLAIGNERRIVVEGFGLLPELLAPTLSSPFQAVWLLSNQDFKLASMARRGKPSFAAQVSDPAKARENLLARDMLLANYLREQMTAYEYTLYDVDGLTSADDLAALVARHFASYS